MKKIIRNLTKTFLGVCMLCSSLKTQAVIIETKQTIEQASAQKSNQTSQAKLSSIQGDFTCRTWGNGIFFINNATLQVSKATGTPDQKNIHETWKGIGILFMRNWQAGEYRVLAGKLKGSFTSSDPKDKQNQSELKLQNLQVRTWGNGQCKVIKGEALLS